MKMKMLCIVLAACMATLLGCGSTKETTATDNNSTWETVAESTEQAEETKVETNESETNDAEANEPETNETEQNAAAEFDVNSVMTQIVDYFQAMLEEGSESQYVIFDNENVDNGETIDFIVRYQPSDEEEDKMIADGKGPLANIYVTKVTVTKASLEAKDEFGTVIPLK